MELPILYKKTSTGKIQQWKIWATDNTFNTEIGQVDGKLRVGVPTICEGKNLGKVSETSPEDQASKEAVARWEKQKKKGYVESIEAASAGEVDEEFISGGVLPMLAEKFRDHGHKMIYPCLGQPKLDGHRATAPGGKLYSRTRKRITSCPHLEKMLAECKLDEYILDGELYNHDFKDDFEALSSAIRKKDPLPPELQGIVQYHLYDIICDSPAEQRQALLKDLYSKHVAGTPYENHIKLVPTEVLNNSDVVTERELHWRHNEGYEGYMLRNPAATYQHLRTPDLQKVKVFQDAEFKVIDAEEGKGKFRSHIAAFVCEIEDERGKRLFKVGLKNVTSDIQKMWFQDSSLWKDKMATVEFLNYTRMNHVPRHGKWLRFRDMVF